MFKVYTDAEVAKLSKAFDKVKNKEHWKNPINAQIKLTEEEKNILHEAIIFYTGSVPRFTKLPNGKYHVAADGYFIAIGA